MNCDGVPDWLIAMLKPVGVVIVVGRRAPQTAINRLLAVVAEAYVADTVVASLVVAPVAVCTSVATACARLGATNNRSVTAQITNTESIHALFTPSDLFG